MSQITVSGLVATTPRHLVTQDGLPITSFRLAQETTTLNGETNTNWLTITSFKQLAINVANSVTKGDRIVVTGQIRVRDWDNGDRAGTSVEIEATSIGHDMAFGTSKFTRNAAVSTKAHSCDCEKCEK